MKIYKLVIDIKETKPFGTEFSVTELFSNDKLALNYIKEKFPEYKEITEEIRKPWHAIDSSRTFYFEKPQYDENGEWDYPIEYTMVLSLATVITE